MKVFPIVILILSLSALIILPDAHTDFSKYTGAFSGLLPGNLPFGG